jgi:hypothetical protein
VQDGGDGAHSAGDSTEDVYFLGNDTPERVFLLARLLFLMTAGDEGLARAMVDEEGIVDALVHVSPASTACAWLCTHTRMFADK